MNLIDTSLLIIERDTLKAQIEDARSTIAIAGCDKQCKELRSENHRLRAMLIRINWQFGTLWLGYTAIWVAILAWVA